MSVLPLSKYEEETNKKLLYSSILLELASQQTEKHYLDALKTSFIIQMLSTYYALLEETQRRLNLAPQPGLNAEEVLKNMQDSSIHSVEIESLAAMEGSRMSWINQLNQAYRELSRSPGLSNLNLISGEQSGDNTLSTSESILADIEKHKQWLKQIETLSENLRNSLSES